MSTKFLKLKAIDEARSEIKRRIKIQRKKERISIEKIEKVFGRVLASEVAAGIDIPNFDKSLKDGYAVIASDTFFASEQNPLFLKVIGSIKAGEDKKIRLAKGGCCYITTGAKLPENADAVIMVEDTRKEGKNKIAVFSPVSPNENIVQKGSDIMQGEVVLREGTLLTSKELGIIAALGIKFVEVYKKPEVGIISTGNELIEPNEKITGAKVFNSNSYAIAASVFESGGKPKILGIAKDNEKEIKRALKIALAECGIVIFSGGTSKGEGDIVIKVMKKFGARIIAHGVSMKPGKPTIIASIKNKLVFALPGNPTSALISFDVFIRVLIRGFSGFKGKGDENELKLKAEIAARHYHERGKREFLLVDLVKTSQNKVKAFPILKESGSVRALYDADGYIEIKENEEAVEEGSEREAKLFKKVNLDRVVFIGSHCFGVELIKKMLSSELKIINLGSAAGLKACESGECDIAGIHLLDAKGGYNLSFVHGKESIVLVRGYLREQGIITRKGDNRIKEVKDLFKKGIRIINRNKGSGTRMLLDMLLKKYGKKREEIIGYEKEARTHSTVANAIATKRAEAGLGIRSAAEEHNLSFIPVSWERYDFAVSRVSLNKTGVKEFLEILKSKEFKKNLESLKGMKCVKDTGEIIYGKK